METIAIFRSCLRKEYRDQVIKMLRAVPEEYTRTSYRFQWVTPQVQEILHSNVPIRIISILVDAELRHGLPCRTLTLTEQPIIDSQLGVYRFALKLGPYVEVPLNFETELASWQGSGDEKPPHAFVTRYDEDWMPLNEIGYGQSLATWKTSISFLTKHWTTFENTVFFRPHGETYAGLPNGPLQSAMQSQESEFKFDSFNPHLSDEVLAKRRLHISVGQVTADISTPPIIPRDGYFDLNLLFLSPGQAAVQVEVRPDEQFSAYVPLTVNVLPNSKVDPSGPRVLGPEWSNFLEILRSDLVGNYKIYGQILDELGKVFPGDPELRLQIGKLHLDELRYGAARDEFQKVINVRKDSRAVWWSLIASLRLGDIKDSQILMDRLDLSRSDLFDDFVETMKELSNQTVQEFSDIPGIALSEEKATRLLLATLDSPRDEETVRVVVKNIGDLNPLLGMQTARRLLSTNFDWHGLRQDIVRLALVTGNFHFIEDDADILLNFTQGPINEYLANVNLMKSLVHPQRLPGILLSNAIRIAAHPDAEHRRTAMSLAIIAAEQSASNGNFLDAQQAMQFIQVHIQEDVQNQLAFTPQIVAISDRIERALRSNTALASIDERYQSELSHDLKDFYTGKSLLIFGGREANEHHQNWKTELGLAELRWLTWNGVEKPEVGKIREFSDSSTSVLIIWQDDGLITESIRSWLLSSKTPHLRVTSNKSSVFDALKSMIPNADGAPIYIPQSCSDAFTWAVRNCNFLEFSSTAADEIEELDGLVNASQVAMRIKNDLVAINKFAKGKSEGTISLSFYDCAPLLGLSPRNVTANESQTTNNNPRYRQERIFPVLPEADSSGYMYMPAHTKIPGTFPKAARIHFTMDTITKIGKAYIGYVGPHLETQQS